MLGDSSSSVLATAATTSGGGGGGGGGGTEAAARQLAVGAREGSSTEFEHHVGSNSGEDQERGGGEESRGAGGGGGGGGGGGDRSFGGNRWPRQETLALLKIRSDMDVAFRDASVKGPLWEDVSRKLEELGYHRSAKKCKEKFENVYKYHKRTKDGRTGKHDGKTYRFFDELEAFENHHHHSSTSSSLPSPPPSQPPQYQTTPTPATATTSMPVANPPPTPHVTVLSTTTTAAPPANISQGKVATAPAAAVNLTVPSFPQTNPTISPFSSQPPNPTNNNNINNNNNPFQTSNVLSSFTTFSWDLFSNSNSSSTSSDVELQGRGKSKRKRKWKDFFGRLMKEVIQKQEDMQKKFLEAIEKREHERLVREESWRMQEMASINREREILAQERSIAAAKDAAVMALLQKVSEQQNPRQVQSNPQRPGPASAVPSPQPLQTPTPPPQNLQVAQAPAPPRQPTLNIETTRRDNGNQNNFMPTSSSRWPKVEVEALIRLRTTLDCKYQESGPKGPLWEDISGGMRKLGYNRSAKRCKEKWENINKYFKKVKESNKKRPEDSKTCPYFHQLDAIYKEKNKVDGPSSSNVPMLPKPENSVPLMVRPEQQWPPPPPPQLEHRAEGDTVMEDLESEDHPNHEDEEDKDTNDDDDDDNDDDEEEDEEAGGYEIVANKPAASMGTNE